MHVLIDSVEDSNSVIIERKRPDWEALCNWVSFANFWSLKLLSLIMSASDWVYVGLPHEENCMVTTLRWNVTFLLPTWRRRSSDYLTMKTRLLLPRDETLLLPSAWGRRRSNYQKSVIMKHRDAFSFNVPAMNTRLIKVTNRLFESSVGVLIHISLVWNSLHAALWLRTFTFCAVVINSEVFCPKSITVVSGGVCVCVCLFSCVHEWDGGVGWGGGLVHGCRETGVTLNNSDLVHLFVSAALA